MFSAPAVTTLIGAVITTAGALWPSDQQTLLDRKRQTVIAFGAFLAALGGVWALVQQNQFQYELSTKSEEIADLNRTIAASVTGGDSFCYLKVALGDGTTNTPSLVLVHNGKYPLYDIGVSIIDLEKFDLIKGNYSSETMEIVETRLCARNMSPGQTQIIRSGWQLPDAAQQRYNVFISARNGFVTQLIRLQHINGHWKSAMKVTRDDYESNKPVVLLERIDPEFPRDKMGQVKW